MRGLRGWTLLAVLAVLLGGCASSTPPPAPPLTPELLAARLGLGVVRAMAVSADGQTLAVAGEAGRAYLWDVDKHRFRAVLSATTDAQAAPALTGVALLSSGDILASSRNGSVYRWSPQGELKGTLNGRNSPLLCLAATSDGSQVIAGTEDGHLLAWDAAGKMQADVTAHRGPVRCLALKASTLVSGGDDFNLSSWALPSLAAGKTLPCGSAVLSMVLDDKDDNVLCGGQDGTIRSVVISTMQQAYALGDLGGPATGLAVAARKLYAGSTAQSVMRWDLGQAGSAKGTKIGEGQGAVHAVAVVKPGTKDIHIAVGGDQRQVNLLLEEARKDQKIAHVGQATVLGVALSADGRWLATVGGSPDLLVWDVATQSLARVVPGDQGNLQAVAWARNGWIATGSDKGAVQILDERGTVITSQHLEAQVNSVAFDPAATRLAVGGWDRQIHVWSLAASQRRVTLVGSLRGHTNGVSSLSFSGDGRLLVSSSWDHSVRIWDVASMQESGRLADRTSMNGPVFSAAFSPASPLVAAGGWHGQTWTWNVDSGSRDKQERLHKDVVYALGFSPDGTLLASGAAGSTKEAGQPGGSITVWNAATMTVNRPLTGFREPVRALAWLSQDRLVAGTLDGFIFHLSLSAASPAPAAAASPVAAGSSPAVSSPTATVRPEPSASAAPATSPMPSPSPGR